MALVGVAAFAVVALLVPADEGSRQASDWRADLGALARRPVLLGLLTTVLGYAGVFAVFTYVAPLITDVVGLEPGAVGPLLFVYGVTGAVGLVAAGSPLARRPTAATRYSSAWPRICSGSIMRTPCSLASVSRSASARLGAQNTMKSASSDIGRPSPKAIWPVAERR